MENPKIIETFRQDKLFLLVLAGLSVLFFLIASWAWPLFIGRDFFTYVDYFKWMFEKENPVHTLMCYHSMLSPVIMGLLLIAGRLAANIFLLLAYVFCNFSFYYLGSLFGRRMGRFFSLLMLVNFCWLVFSHEFSGDLLLGIGLIFWAVYFVRTAGTSSLRQYAFLGLATFSLALIRPVAQIFVLMFLAPLWLRGINKRSFYAAGIFLAVWLTAYFSYASYNQVRYDCFTLARGGNFTIPAYKIFIQDRAMAPDNGPASRLLAAAVEKDLLDKPPYRENNIDLKTFFSSGDVAMFGDLGDLSNRIWGWASDYRIVRQAALEALARHPVKIIASSLKNALGVFMQNYNFPRFAGITGVPASPDGAKPLIADSYVTWMISGSSKTEAQIETHGWVSRVYYQAIDKFATPPGNFLIEKALSRLGSLFPPTIFFLAVSLLLLGRLKETKVKILASLFVPAFLGVIIPVAAITPSPQYRLPFDFIFILAGLTAFFGSPWIRSGLRSFLPLELARGKSNVPALPLETGDFRYSSIGKENLDSVERADNFTAWLYSEIKPFIPGGNILEIGSGTGIYSAKIIKDFPKSEFVLSDLDNELMARLKDEFGRHPKAHFLKLDASRAEDFEALPFKMDCVIATNVLEHVADDSAALKNIYSCLSDGGRFIVLAPAYQALFNVIDKSIGHYRRYTKEDLAAKAKEAGFKVSKIFYFNFFSIFGWYLNGNILKKKAVDGVLLRFFNLIIPVLRVIEKNVFRGRVGISLIMVLDK